MTYRIHATHPDAAGYSLGTPNDLLFGALAGKDDGYSLPFATLAEAETALAALNNTGDWDGERPTYEIEKQDKPA